MDAIELLKHDHETLRGLLQKLSDTSAAAVKTRTELLGRIRKELEIHTTIEEEIFYPALRQVAESSEDCEMVFEALEEHRAAGELVLPDLLDTEPGSDRFGGRAKVLKELVEHHAKEEEDDMFKRARKLLGKQELETLGERMEQRKRELAH